jgi:hypothetical protein
MKCVIAPVLLLAALAAGADVGVDTILVPGATVDSGRHGTPRIALGNYSDVEATVVGVHFEVLDPTRVVYHDSLYIPAIPPHSKDTVEFSMFGWLPYQRDTLTAVCWTTCTEDTNPANDTFVKKVFVRVKDIGLTDLWPAGDTFDSGQAIVPHVHAWNYGNITMSFVVWSDSATLPAGGDRVMYGDSLTCVPGVWTIEAYALVPGDLYPANNRIVDTFYVRGTIEHRMGVRVFGPDTVDTLTPAVFGVVVTNLTRNTESFWMCLLAAESARTQYFYRESLQVMIGGNDSLQTNVALHLTEPGCYVVACSLSLPGGNDTVDYHYFWVVPGSGVEESGQPIGYSSQPTATVIRGVLRVGDRGPGTGDRMELLDAAGRKVMALHTGSNDVSRLAPGVYFVREPSAVSGQPSAVRRKVILQR